MNEKWLHAFGLLPSATNTRIDCHWWTMAAKPVKYKVSSNIMNSLSFPNDSNANLEAFHPLVPVIYTDVKQTSHFLLKFGNYISLWPWKLGQGYQTLISSFWIRIQFSYASQYTGFWTVYTKLICSTIICVLNLNMTLKLRSRSPKSNHLLILPQ